MWTVRLLFILELHLSEFYGQKSQCVSALLVLTCYEERFRKENNALLFPRSTYWKHRLCIVDFIIMLRTLSPEVLLPALILNCCYFAV